MTASRLSRVRQRGAAILLAMLIMTLVATLAAGMVWLQWRGIEVESAERARGQGEWLLNGALDWARLILKSAKRASQTDDDLTQPWAMPLAESRLSSFLSTDDNHADDSGPDAFLSGQISDANARYNLHVLGSPIGKVDQGFVILCDAVGVSQDTAMLISSGMAQSYSARTAAGEDGVASGSAPASAPVAKDDTNSVVLPQRVEDLAWYGVDPTQLKMLEPYVVILPDVGVVNANTAPAEVLMAAMPGLSRTDAQVVVQKRQAKPFATIADLKAALPATLAASTPATVGVTSDYFEVFGQLRYEQHVLRERTLVHRNGQTIDVVRRERLPPDVQ